MTNVMSKAWEIAKAGQVKFGGKVKEYFAQALKMAWALSRKVTTATIVTGSGSRKFKTYVAQIVGTDARFGLSRDFLTPVQASEYSDKTFTLNLTEGDVFEVQGASYNCDRHYVMVVNGELERTNVNTVKAMFA